mmetsp:Transcript_16836/g.35721  ORF Transcript_16836/g.35721 Transcript_16836/m.35721 type:complete len:270 (-) Transcript_16836:469-1278(-)
MSLSDDHAGARERRHVGARLLQHAALPLVAILHASKARQVIHGYHPGQVTHGYHPARHSRHFFRSWLLPRQAGRAVCADGTEARRYDAFCDLHRAALAISEIGQVRQVVSLDPPMLTSEFEVRAGAVPFLSDVLPFLRYSGGLPLTIEGSIVSSASIDTVNDDSYTLYMDTVEIKGSNVPLLRQVLDSGLRLESRNLGGLLEQNLPGYSNPKPLFRTTYVDDTMRICRDQDGKLFVYSKLSNATSTTDYSDVTADLGVGSLLSSLSLLI